MERIVTNPVYETLIQRAFFVNQDIVVFPSGARLPSNIADVVKFLFGEGARLRVDRVEEHPCLIIEGASYLLRNAKTINAKWACRECNEG